MNDPQNEPRTCPYCDQPRQDTFENRFRFECGTSLRADDHKTIKQGDACQLRVELRAAQAELADRRDSDQRILSEQCPSDEQHCACVPTLRREVARLREALEVLANIPTGCQCELSNMELDAWENARAALAKEGQR
jgi:hypothetical protein